MLASAVALHPSTCIHRPEFIGLAFIGSRTGGSILDATLATAVMAGGKLTVANALALLSTLFTSYALSLRGPCHFVDLPSFNPDRPNSSVLTPLLLSHPSLRNA
jgi:hypothetical protein